MDNQSKLSTLPSVDRVLASPSLAEWRESRFTTEAVREALEEIRAELRSGPAIIPPINEIANRACRLLEKRFVPRLLRVINGTGILAHTNLGRVPLSEEAIAAMVEAARGYSTLEYDLDRGERGSRHFLVHQLLTALTGAEDALVTNNNAAALLLALTALGRRKEVIVSRGQLIEIGGSFRLPEICRAGGVKMREVGTTNRTRLSDYEEAITSKTALLLRVHASNYRIVGFTEETSLLELVMLGKRHQIPVVDDLGSGDLIGVSERIGLAGEPLVMTSVHAGASVVTFSGDKLLGGPQAGIAVGQAEMITKMRKHPLMRAVRPGKLTFAALDATLRAYLFPSALGEKLPLWKMLEASLETLEKKGKLLIAAIEDSVKAKGFQVNLLMSEAYSGGGSLPTQCLPSRAITFNASGRKLLRLQKHLRQGNPALIGYLKDSSLKLDLRTMLLESDEEIIQVIQSALLQR